MTKKQFLKQLEDKLKVLNENEIKDILDEYETIIDDKVSHGKTVKEAIEDFGDINELSEEILKAYKINPEYSKEDGFEETVKKVANKLADGAKKVVDEVKKEDSAITTESIFEILIKVVIFLFAIAFLRIPFWIIDGLGESIIGGLFVPIDKFVLVIWDIIMWLLYVGAVIIVGILIFKKTVAKYENKNYKKEPVKKNINKEKTEKEEVKVVETKHSAVENVFTLLLKIFAIIVLVIPLISTLFGLYVALIFLIYLIFKGVVFIGPIVLLIGMITMADTVYHLIMNVIFLKKKVHFIPFLAGAIIFVLGCLLSVDLALDFKFNNKVPNVNYDYITESYINQITDEDMRIRLEYGEKNLIVDESVEDNQYRIDISYYKDLIEITRETDDDTDRIEIEETNFNVSRDMYNLIIKDLKHREINNYGKLFKVKVDVYANSKTISKIR